MMNYIEVSQFGAAEVLEIKQGPKPIVESGEVLIQVYAAGINRADLALRAGQYPGVSTLPTQLGLEVSGRIAAIADDVTQFKVGDLVCALTDGDGYAEYVSVAETQCFTVPRGLSLLEAATLPEATMTIWSNLFDKNPLTAGDSILIHGGTSGIGTFAIQLAKAIGATVLTTVGGLEKQLIAQQLGADCVINYHQEDFVSKVLEFTHQKGVNVILDMVGGDYTARNIASLAMDGQLIQLSTLKGSIVNIDLRAIMQRRALLTGALLKARNQKDKARIAQGVMREFWPLLENRTVMPIINKSYDFHDVQQAHRDMEQGDHIGKLVLRFQG